MNTGAGITVRRRALFGALFILLLVFIGWHNRHRERPFHFTRFAMDTTIEYTIMAPDRDSARQAMLAAHREVQRIEGLFWEGDTASEISRFNRAPRGIATTGEVFGFLQRAQGHSRQTGGFFDLTIKPVLELYPFQQDNPRPPSAGQISRAVQQVGWQGLKLAGQTGDSLWLLTKTRPAVQLTVGGMAKGYAVDRAIRVLAAGGVAHALINAGGDLYCLGNKNGRPWTVGIQHPRQAGELAGTLALSNRAVATSGDYQRFFMFAGVRYHHILDPATGKPAKTARSATVIAPAAEAADAWATALFVLGYEKGLELIDEQPEVYGMVIDSTGTAYYSTGFREFLSR